MRYSGKSLLNFEQSLTGRRKVLKFGDFNILGQRLGVHLFLFHLTLPNILDLQLYFTQKQI